MVKNKGQVTLELALAIVMVMLLFWAAGMVFLWINSQLFIRQRSYESTRTTGGVIDEDTLPHLDFFK